MHLQAGRLYRERDNPYVYLTVFQFLDDLVAEVPINADLDSRIKPTILGKHLRQDVQASGFVGANPQSAAGSCALVGYRQQRLITQFQEPLAVSKQHSARGCEPYDFS